MPARSGSNDSGDGKKGDTKPTKKPKPVKKSAKGSSPLKKTVALTQKVIYGYKVGLDSTMIIHYLQVKPSSKKKVLAEEDAPPPITEVLSFKSRL